MRVAISTSFSDTLNFDWSRRVRVPKVSGSFTKSTMPYAKLNSYVFLKNSTPVTFVALMLPFIERGIPRPVRDGELVLAIFL